MPGAVVGKTWGTVCSYRGGEDLGHGLLVSVGDVPARIEEIPILILLLPGPGAAGPFVVLAGMVHDEVETDGDAPLMAVLGKSGKILHGAQLRLDLPKVADGVASVAAALGTLQKGHEVQVIHATVLDVAEFLPNALKRPGKGVHVHEHAHQIVALVPVGMGFPGPIHEL